MAVSSMEVLSMSRASTDTTAAEHFYVFQASRTNLVCGRRSPSILRSSFLCSTALLQGKSASCGRKGNGKLWSLQVSSSMLGEDPEWSEDDYITVGLSHCFEQVDGVLKNVFLIEPVSASTLECLENGGATSYLHVTGSTLGTALKHDVSVLPAEFAKGQFCKEFDFRAKCVARTWKMPHPVKVLMSIAPVGTVRSQYNFSLKDKRVINKERVVTDADNIKQDLSIDVYGRNTEEKEEQKVEIAGLYNA